MAYFPPPADDPIADAGTTYFPPPADDPIADPSEGLKIWSQATKGTGNLLDFVDQLSPIRPEKLADPNRSAIDSTLNPLGLGVPSVFGLRDKVASIFSTPQSTAPLEPASSLLKNQLGSIGYYTDQTPQTEGGKLAGDVLREGIPGAIAGPAGLVSSAVLGGGGAYAAKRFLKDVPIPLIGKDFSPLVLSPQILEAVGSAGSQLGFGGLTKLASKGAELVGPLTQAGRDAAIRSVIRGSTADAPATMMALEKAGTGVADNLTPFATTAEVTGDTGIARLDNIVRNRFNMSPIEAANVERAGVRSKNLETLFSPETDQYATSKALEGVIGEAGANLSDKANELWKGVDKSTVIEASDAPALLESAITKMHAEVSTAPPDAQKLFGQITDRIASDEPVTVGLVQDWRAKLGVWERASKATPKEAATYRNMNNALGDVLDLNAEAGIMGADTAEAYKAARAATATKYSTFEGTPELKIASGTGGGQILDDKFVKEILRSPDEFGRVLAAAEAGQANARPVLRQALMASITHDAKTGAELAQSKWAGAYAQRSRQFEQVFDPEELAIIERQIQDIASQGSVGSKANAIGGSPTNRLTEGGKPIDSAMGILRPGFTGGLDKIAPVIAGVAGYSHGPVATGVSALGGLIASNLVKKALSGPTRAFESRLMEAVQNPAVAREILSGSRPTLEALDAAFSPIMGGAARAGIKTQLPSTTPQQQDDFQVKSYTSGDPVPRKPLNLDSIAADSLKLPSELNSTTEPVRLDGYNIEDVLDGLRQVESGGGKHLKSPAGALGPYQFMPATAKDLGLKDPMDEVASRDAARTYLLWLYNQTGSLEKALSAYNFGVGNVKKGKAYPKETQEYAPKVFAAIKKLTGEA